ncbi:uncharacterized protein LOC143817614 [Ranitomeya variabilis]|uniref:uncharacterized protein LOC143817614 n=1 Tax=Ranitomeya variabilis TaxID=490064 RepID=UPI004056F4E9
MLFLEAIDTIVRNSKSTHELLNRRKVVRGVIATHLKNEGISVPTNFTKNEVIQKTLAHWNNLESIPAVIFTPIKDPVTSSPVIIPQKISDVPVQQRQKAWSNVPLSLFSTDISKLSIHSSQREEKREQRSPMQTCRPQEIIPATIFTPIKHPVTPPSIITPAKVSDMSFQQRQKVSSNVLIVPDISKLSIHSSQRGERKEQRSPSQTCYPQTVPHMTTHSKIQAVPKTEKVLDTRYTNFMQCNRKVFQPPTIPPSLPYKINTKEVVTSLSSTTKCSPATESEKADGCYCLQDKEHTSYIWPVDCGTFTHDFCKWFYTLLNSQHESSGLQKKDWGPQHFLENAVLQLTYMSVKTKYNGGRSASARLLALVHEDKLSFQPNLTSKGIKCKKSPEGIVVMMVSGTIFRDNDLFFGTFDQVFEVVWNSTSNNWKIQFIVLNIQKIENNEIMK